jgi:hypothetical protein
MTAELLDEMHSALTSYVVLPSAASGDAVTLWIAATHCLPAFQHAPRLAIVSPEKRCGKSRLLDIIAGTCHEPLMTINATVAAVFRSIGGDKPPTLLVDEADTLFGSKKVAENNEELRALLNAGHQRGRPARRCVGPQQIPTDFPTFTMCALAGIGQLPDTITDRAINITMRRRRSDEPVRQFRTRRDGPRLEALRLQLAEWSTGATNRLMDAEPDMPVEDRAADTWEPLVAVADLAGGEWPERARHACKVLTEEAEAADEERSLNTRLLSDVRAIFTERMSSFIASADLVGELKRIAESPWGDFDFNARKLAYRLKDFGVRPGFNTAKTARGYRLDELHDAFGRYLRPEASEASDTGSDLRERSDASQAPDGYICPDENKRPEEAAGQPTFRTLRTVSDDPPAGKRRRAGLTSADAAVRRQSDGIENLPLPWVPADEPIGPCRDCGEPALTYDADGQPCHLGCAS